MSSIQTYDASDIVAIEAPEKTPGSVVRHWGDKRSLGTVISIDERHITSRQVAVLWSKEPRVEPEIPTQRDPRLLGAKWSITQEDADKDMMGVRRRPLASHSIECEERYSMHDFDENLSNKFFNERADVTFHEDGTVVVKRRLEGTPDNLRYVKDRYGQR